MLDELHLPVTVRDTVGERHQVGAVAVDALFRPRWEGEPQRSGPSGLVRTTWVLPHSGRDKFAAVSLGVFVTTAAVAAATCGEGPLAAVWHHLFG